MEPSTPAQPRPSTAVFRHPPRSVAFIHKVQPRPSIYSVVLTFFLSLRRRVAPTFRGKTCLLATNQAKLEKAQADYDQALGAYNRAEELLKKAEERLGKAFEDGVEGERLQFLKDALANAKDALANAKDVLANAKVREDRAWQTVELERKQTPQSEEMTPETAYKAIEEGIKKGQYKVPDPPVCPDIVEGSRQNAIDIMKDYIAQSIKQANRGKTDNKFPLLGTSGMAGIGKTTMLLYGLQELIGTGGKGVYLSFNGNGTANSNVFADSKASSADRLSLHCFGDVLMAVLGVQDDLYRVLKFQQSLTLFRTAMDMTEEQPLVLFIDEVGHLKEPDGLLKELMSEADSRDGKLVFVFAHISQQYLNMCATGSGRTVIPLPLEALPIDAWKQDADLKVSAQGHAGIHQLLLQCCGHPRSLFDGVEEARKKNPTLLTNPTEAVLSVARQNIIDACKFNSFAHPYLQTVIPKWFSILGKTPQFHDQLRRDGLLLEVKETEATVFFPPLVLHHYATTYAEENSLCFHLQQAYAHDAMLGKFAEKNMEGLLYHYEAVLRKAVEGQTFTLKQFYRSKHCGERFEDLEVKAPVPKRTDLVERLPNFQDEKRVLGQLKRGFIVVSDLQNEVGIEYLAPFRTAEDNKLIVACVQCKFVEKSPDSSWRKIQTKMSTATDWLKNRKIQHFPVIYTTADQSYMQRQSYEDGIYFIEDDIFEFTKKLGVLHLHTQKLGEKVQQKHPYLQRASSNADM